MNRSARERSYSIDMRDIAALVLTAIVLTGVVLAGTDTRAPIASSETQFVEKSAGGLNIVPASCASRPHYTGECSNPSACWINAAAINAGSIVALSWHAPTPGAGTLYNQSINTLGSVARTGTAMVPDLSPGYTLTVTNAATGAFVISCSTSGGPAVCPTGQHMTDGGCVCNNANEVLVNGQCTIPGGQCSTGYFCQGNEQWRRTAQCTDEFVQTCPFGCSGGGCLPAPAGNGNITATPSLVRSGDRTTIAWTTSGLTEDSCSVSENNPTITDSWIGDSGTRTSSALREQTTYTLSCTTLTDEPFTDSVVVNIIPIFEEQ